MEFLSSEAESSNELLIKLLVEVSRMRAAMAFAEYVTASELRLLFGMGEHAIMRMKRRGLKSVNSGTKKDVFRVQDIKEQFESPDELPNRKKRRAKAK